MRIAITSDLHLPKTPAAVIEGLAADMAAYSPDVAVLAGDLGESSTDFEPSLTLFRKLACPVLVLAGNHDVFPGWASSQKLGQHVLPDTVRRLGFHWLEGDPFVHGGITVAGTIAWYDFSAADAAVGASPLDFAREKHYFRPDDRIDWCWTDPEFAGVVGKDFLRVLDRLESDAAVKQVLALTHVPILGCQILPWPANPDWGFMRAYFGNLTLGREVVRRGKVTHVVSGHTHRAFEGRISLEGSREVEVRVVGLAEGLPGWVRLAIPPSGVG
jgi:3',5'-cyclic AMP phosphodiesterase CpdA